MLVDGGCGFFCDCFCKTVVEKCMKWLKKVNAVMLAKLVVVALVMFGFGWALIPLYNTICELTGVNVLARQTGSFVEKPNNSLIDKNRLITIEFDANTVGPLRFRPLLNSMRVHPGQLVEIQYEVVNALPKKVNVQAIPSYAPQQAERYFMKIECFCFQQQVLAAHEAKQMPVMFYIDPKLPKSIDTITLSYTFFEIAGAKEAD